MALFSTLLIPLILLLLLRLLFGKFFFLTIGIIWFCLFLLAPTNSSALLKAKRTSCASNMKFICFVLRDKNPNGANWFEFVKEDFSGQCPGFGADEDSYLFIPEGMNNDKYPLLIEYLHNHLERGTDFLFFDRLKDAGGMNLVYRDQSVRWLNAEDVPDFRKELSDGNIISYDRNAKPKELSAPGRKSCHYAVRIEHVVRANISMALLLIGLGLFRLIKATMPTNDKDMILRTAVENQKSS